jgi:demethylmenaquinone methyltransferase/2-methoxy-6-polyprenyl-1,4-benzoquinol methylase
MPAPVTETRPRRRTEKPLWDDASLRDPHAQPDKADRVRAMFDAVAPAYERVNTVASFGRDAIWRRRTIAAADIRPGDIALDVCCGTGDMVRTMAAHTTPPALIIGLDFSAEMLRHGHYNGAPTPISIVRGDALQLPLRSASVDVITCAFGIRNFARLQPGLDEMHRVLRPGGRLLVLEFANPDNRILRFMYRMYCERILPLMTLALSPERTNAYRYLARSIRTFETTRSIVRRLRDAGFADVTTTHMNLGGVILIRAVKHR